MNDGPLSDDEAALVFRRASELDVELQHRRDGWDVAGLEAVAGEVGIAPEAVRQAVAEVRLGAAAPTGAEVVRRTRLVRVSAADAQSSLSSWLREQLLDPVRERPGAARFDRRTDAEADVKRRRDDRHRYRLTTVERVEVAVASLPGGGTAVLLDATLRTTRHRDAIRRAAVAAPGTWVAGALVAGATPISLGLITLATPLLVGGAGVWAWRSSGSATAAVAGEVGVTLDAALDRLS